MATPDDWVEVITTAKEQAPVFYVTKMTGDDFFASKTLELCITNRKKNHLKEKIN